MEYQQYFRTVNHYFWQNEETEGVFAIPGAGTIAYRDFVTDILKHLAPQGIPPFGSMLLAIIATNPNGAADLDTVFHIINNHMLQWDFEHDASSDCLIDAINFLKLLAQLPKQYKQGKNRVLVYQAIFNKCHNISSAKDAAKVVDMYTITRNMKNVGYESAAFNATIFINDFRPIALLKNKFRTVDDIIKRILSLPELPAEQLALEFEENSEDTTTKDFVDQLIDNSKTFHVGSLVRRIWSGLNIPVHSQLPSQQPLGGVSDLTNKGDLDKLLISEFANDDLLFLSRLANNEALYINREIPPEQNNKQRVILIDVSLKNWGTPKSVAFATMLAIARHPKTDIECTAYVVGNGYHPVVIDTVDGLIDSLQILDASLHAANGLAAFFKDTPADKNREVFVITAPSTLKNAAMLRAVHDYHSLVHYWIYTDVDGNIDVYKKQQSSKKHVQHILLPLQELWQREKKQVKKYERNDEENYPILFRIGGNTKDIFNVSGGDTYHISSERSVMKLYNNDRTSAAGWDLLPYKVPNGASKFALGIGVGQAYHLLMFNPNNKVITILNLSNGNLISSNFDRWVNSAKEHFIFYSGEFYYLGLGHYWKISLDGTISAYTDNLPGLFAAYETKSKEAIELQSRFKTKTPILKNINDVFINQLGNLVFNVHELTLTSASYFKIEKSGFLKPQYKTTRVHDYAFSFADGSTVEVNRNGMLILKSSNPNIPTIYIPSVIEATIGMATHTEFAGNDYYYKYAQLSIMVNKVGNSKLNVIKLVKDASGCGLQDAVNAVEGMRPLQLKVGVDKKLLRSELGKLGADVSFLSEASNEGENTAKITTTAFFDKYINAFIKNITANGT